MQKEAADRVCAFHRLSHSRRGADAQSVWQRQRAQQTGDIRDPQSVVESTYVVFADREFVRKAGRTAGILVPRQESALRCVKGTPQRVVDRFYRRSEVFPGYVAQVVCRSLGISTRLAEDLQNLILG